MGVGLGPLPPPLVYASGRSVCSALSITCACVCVVCALRQQEAQLSPRDRAMRRVSCILANCHATVQKLLVQQVLNQVSAVANCTVRQNRAVDSACRSVR